MRKGVVILRPPTDTHEIRAQVVEILSNRGWRCEPRTRFDGVTAVAVELPADAEASSGEEVEALLREAPLLADASFDVKAQD